MIEINRRSFCRSTITAFSAAAPLAGEPLPPFPHTSLSNGIIDALVFLPDAKAGYYRSVRFDWSGMLAQVRWKEHTFFQPWESSNELAESLRAHNPNATGDGAGIAEEFRNPLGYDAARPGTPFVKVGVGLLIRPDDRPYHFARAYDLRLAPPWQVSTGKDQIKFVQKLNSGFGYGYQYTKRIVLERGASLVVAHELENTGTRQIRTNTYCHNFFQFDGKPAGPGYEVDFAAPVQPEGDLKGWADSQGNTLRILHRFGGADALGFPIVVEGRRNEFAVTNRQTATTVRVSGSMKLVSFYLWTSASSVCPEPMIDIELEPGGVARWDNRYIFEEGK
jgi:hypothetical protein